MKSLQFFFSAAALLIFAGCATEVPYVPSVNTVSNAESTAQIKRIIDRRVETDPYLSQLLYITEIRESQTNDGYKRIQVFFKNLSGNTYTFMYRFSWSDQNGVEVSNPDNEMWVRKIVAAGDDITLTAIAPQRDCQDFKLRLKASY